MKEKRELIAVITGGRLDEDTLIAPTPGSSAEAMDDYFGTAKKAPKGQVFVGSDEDK